MLKKYEASEAEAVWAWLRLCIQREAGQHHVHTPAWKGGHEERTLFPSQSKPCLQSLHLCPLVVFLSSSMLIFNFAARKKSTTARLLAARRPQSARPGAQGRTPRGAKEKHERRKPKRNSKVTGIECCSHAPGRSRAKQETPPKTCLRPLQSAGALGPGATRAEKPHKALAGHSANGAWRPLSVVNLASKMRCRVLPTRQNETAATKHGRVAESIELHMSLQHLESRDRLPPHSLPSRMVASYATREEHIASSSSQSGGMVNLSARLWSRELALKRMKMR